MVTNILRKYNELLELVSTDKRGVAEAIYPVFKRDIVDHPNFCFEAKPIHPTPKDGEPPMETLFNHLTTRMEDEATRSRAFDFQRSVRIHWIKHHIEKQVPEKLLIFSADDGKSGVRTYVYDRDESYVIVLEPLRNKTAYYLLSAYYLDGRNPQKMNAKYKRRLPDVW